MTADPDESPADTEYRKRKQELFIQDLLRFGIKTILVSNYSEITDLLHSLEMAYRCKSVFLSGAAHEYGRWNRDEAENFIYQLAKGLSASKLRIVSGFGLGVGSSVITGVLENVYMKGGRLDSDQLILRPFPQAKVGQRELAEVWNDYRTDMISYAGIAVFLFGNKLREGEIIESDGLFKEFNIAKEQGLILLPVGATGYASSQLYESLVDEGYFSTDNFPAELDKDIKIIGDSESDLDAVRASILNIVNVIK